MNEMTEILKERGNRYGRFSGTAKIVQSIKTAMQEGRNWQRLSDDKKEALEMVAHKIARILNGDQEYLDSWTDIVGYAQLVVDNLKEAQDEA